MTGGGTSKIRGLKILKKGRFQNPNSGRGDQISTAYLSDIGLGFRVKNLKIKEGINQKIKLATFYIINIKI